MNNRSIPLTHAERKITVHSHKHSFTPYPFLSPYWRTELGTEEQIHLLRVGWRTFFPVVLLCQVFGCGGNSFRWYLPTILVVPLCLFFVAVGNSFRWHRSVFWLWQDNVLGVTSLPIVPYQLCHCVSFMVRREIVFSYSVSKKDSYLVSLIERRTASKCVYFVRSKHFYSVSLNSLSISCIRKVGNFLSAFCEG